MDQQSTRLQSNADGYIDGVYSKYQAGEISLNETLSAVELASHASGDVDSTGYYGFQAVELALLGYDTDLNSSFSVTLNGNESLNGTLFYTADDLGQVQAGETYDLSTLNGVFFVATPDENGTGTVRTIESGTITVESITDPRTGDSRQNTTFVSYTADSFDSSELKSEVDRLSALADFYERQQSNTGTGIPLGSDDKLIIGIVAAAVIVLALRD